MSSADHFEKFGFWLNRYICRENQYWCGLAVHFFGADLKLVSPILCNFQSLSPLEVSYELWQDFVCVDHGVRPEASKLHAMGFRHSVHRSTLADANESRNWRIWADSAAVLIRRARKLYVDEDLGLDLRVNRVHLRNTLRHNICLVYCSIDIFHL